MELFPAKRGHLFHDHNEGRELLVKDDKQEEECFVLNFLLFYSLAYTFRLISRVKIVSTSYQLFVNFVSTFCQQYVC